MSPTESKNPRRRSTSPFLRPEPEPEPIYELEDRVNHDSFGLGKVVGLESGRALRIDFGCQTERITLPCKKLAKF